MSSSLPKILETEINVFISSSQIITIKTYYEKSTIYKCGVQRPTEQFLNPKFKTKFLLVLMYLCHNKQYYKSKQCSGKNIISGGKKLNGKIKRKQTRSLL